MVRRRLEPPRREPTAITVTTTVATGTPTAIGCAQISIEARPTRGRRLGQSYPPSVFGMDPSLSLKAQSANWATAATSGACD
jgi:hypothetical protein